MHFSLHSETYRIVRQSQGRPIAPARLSVLNRDPLDRMVQLATTRDSIGTRLLGYSKPTRARNIIANMLWFPPLRYPTSSLLSSGSSVIRLKEPFGEPFDLGAGARDMATLSSS